MSSPRYPFFLSDSGLQLERRRRSANTCFSSDKLVRKCAKAAERASDRSTPSILQRAETSEWNDTGEISLHFLPLSLPNLNIERTCASVLRERKGMGAEALAEQAAAAATRSIER